MGQHQNTREVGVWTLMYGWSLVQMEDHFPLSCSYTLIMHMVSL